MPSNPSVKLLTTRVLVTTLLCSLLFTFGVALLNKPILRPEKFWSMVDADQGMFTGYMLKKYHEVPYTKDFSFTIDPNIYQLYNPLEMFILYKSFLLFDHNTPAAFYFMLLMFSFVYFYFVFIVMYFFSDSLLIAGFMTLFSTAWRYMGFCADVWGMAVVQNARSAYYVLPMLALSMLVVLRTYQSDNSWKAFGAFCTVGLVAWMHPVTGYHWIAACWTIGLIHDIVLKRRYVFFSLVRILGLLAGSLPTLVSLVQNALFGMGKAHALEVPSRQILEASIVINPTYYCHVMPELLARFPLPLRALLVPSMEVGIIAGVAIFLYILIRLIRGAHEKLLLSPGNHRRLFIILYGITSILFVGFTALSNPVNMLSTEKGLYLSYAIVVCGFAFVLVVNLLRILKSERPSTFDTLLLATMSFSLLFSVAGSWVINAILNYIDYPVRFFEQMRGIRIAYLVFLLWSASSLGYYFTSSRRIGVCLVVFLSLPALSFYAKSFQNMYREPSDKEVNFYATSNWIRNNTDASCLTALLIGDPWQTASEHARFKALAQRSMTYSYDCYQLAYTNASALVPARQRVDDITKDSKTPDGIAEYVKQYSPDYIVVAKDQVRADDLQHIVYENETYAVVQR